MRKLLYLLVMCSFVLWGCNKGNDDIKPEDPDNTTNVYLEVYPSELVFEALGGEQSVRIGCFDDDANAQKWMITGDSEWCKTDLSEGNGYGEVTVTVDAYSETQDRNTNLTIKSGDKSYVLTVTQKHGDAIVLSKDKFDVPEEGGTVTIEVKSNIEYEVFIPFWWIEQVSESNSVTKKSLTFTVSENEDYEKREGYILFFGDSREETVFIYQVQKNQLVLNQSTYVVPTAGAEITVELKTNIDYEVRIPGDAASWISQISIKAIREDRLKFQITANSGSDERIARIVIQDKNSDLSDTVRVIQVTKGTYGGDLVWETEQDLIDFHAAGHTKVIGNIVVQGNKIKTLQRLDNILTEIDGSITFNCKTLSTFDGLYGLKKISGNLMIQEGSMTSFEGLQNLEEIGGNFKVIASSSSSYPCLSSLASFSGLSSLKRIGGDFEVNASSASYSPTPYGILSLNSLSSFKGLEGLEEIAGSFKVISSSYTASYYPYLYSVNSLSSLTSFSGLSSLKRIGGDFEVNASTSISGAGANGSTLNSLSSFKGLEGLEEIGGRKLTITNCYVLNNIDALSKVSALDEISITGCSKLYDFCVLKNVVQSMSGTFSTKGNGYNPTKEQLLNGKCSQTPNK